MKFSKTVLIPPILVCLITAFLQAISDSIITLFEKISEDLRPTPIHPHYVFTQHDIARVFQGMMLLSSKAKTRPRAKARKKTPKIENTNEKTSKESSRVSDQTLKSDDNGKKDIDNDNKLRDENRYVYECIHIKKLPQSCSTLYQMCFDITISHESFYQYYKVLLNFVKYADKNKRENSCLTQYSHRTQLILSQFLVIFVIFYCCVTTDISMFSLQMS